VIRLHYVHEERYYVVRVFSGVDDGTDGGAIEIVREPRLALSALLDLRRLVTPYTTDSSMASMHTLGMEAHVTGAQDVFLCPDGGLHLAFDHVDDGFVSVCMKRCADTRIVDLQKGHLVALDKRLHEQASTVGGLALDGLDPDGFHSGVS